MINFDALCVHCKTLLSGFLKDSDLRSWIGSLKEMNEPTFLKWCSELSLLLSLRLQGRIDEIDPDGYSVMSFIKNSDQLSLTNIDQSKSIPKLLPKDRIVRTIMSFDGSSPSVQKIWSGLMKLKTSIPPRLTRKPSRVKLKEHSDSITMSFNGDPMVFPEIENNIRLITRKLVKQAKLSESSINEYYLPFTHHPASDKSFTCPLPDKSTAKTSSRALLEPYNIDRFLRTQEAYNLYMCDPDIFCSRLFVGKQCRNCTFDYEAFKPLSPIGSIPLSVIGFIPQPGDKERVVAIPTAFMQSLSYPLGKIAKRLNSSWKVQGVDSHKETCEYISTILQSFNGEKIFHSIDMSNFTDRLPYEGVISVILDELINLHICSTFDKMLMDYICQSSILIDNQIKSYGVGTPMGTFPSFPFASMANGIIATIAFYYSTSIPIEKIRINDLPFRIIGDDIVIWHKCAEDYSKLMTRLGVEVQPSKCMVSNHVAEMCSKVITALGVNQQKRIDPLYMSRSLQSAIDIYLYYGPCILPYLNSQICDFLGSLSGIPGPLGLGPDVDDPFWDNQPSIRSIFDALYKALSFNKENSFVDAKDFQIMSDRSNLIPQTFKFEVVSDDTGNQFRLNPLLESLEDEVLRNLKTLTSTSSSFPMKLEAATRIQVLYTELTTSFATEYFEKKYLLADYHLHSRRKAISVDGFDKPNKIYEDLIALRGSISTDLNIGKDI